MHILDSPRMMVSLRTLRGAKKLPLGASKIENVCTTLTNVYLKADALVVRFNMVVSRCSHGSHVHVAVDAVCCRCGA